MLNVDMSHRVVASRYSMVVACYGYSKMRDIQLTTLQLLQLVTANSAHRVLHRRAGRCSTIVYVISANNDDVGHTHRETLVAL